MMRWCLLVTVMAAVLATGARAQRPEPSPASTMRQLMQAILFPNANVIFAAQGDDPASVPRDARPSLSTNPLAGVYGGWQAVENSGLALAEAADLLNVRGRLCANGKPVPVEEAEWRAAVQTLRDAGIAAAAAARSRSQDAIVDVAEQVTTACGGCHRLYRTRDNSCTLAAPPR